MDRRRLYGVSPDSPSYFRTNQYTELLSEATRPTRTKGTASMLHLGVSSEAPDNFHLKYASVVSPERRNGLLERAVGFTSDRAGISALQHSPSTRQHGEFRYQDFGDHQGEVIDQTTLKPTSFIDLLVGKNTAKQYKLPYYREYYSALSNSGFAHQPSQLAQVNKQNDLLVRKDIRVLRSLQNSLNHSKLQSTRKHSHAQLSGDSNSQVPSKPLKQSYRRYPSHEAGQTLAAIEDFEGRLEVSRKLPPIYKTSWEKYQWSD